MTRTAQEGKYQQDGGLDKYEWKCHLESLLV
jgi:hypothetical protein